MADERQQGMATAAPSLDVGAAKELARAAEGKIAFLKGIVDHTVSGKLPGVSLAEVLKGATSGGGCGIGCC